MCGHGYTVSGSETNFYFASDLLHRLYHVPKIGEETVEHYAGDYKECLKLAETNPEKTVRNSDSLQYFALEAYAFDIAIPGEGCVGKSESQPTSTSIPTTTEVSTPTTTSDAATVFSSTIALSGLR